MDEKKEDLNLQAQESTKERVFRQTKYSFFRTYYTLLNFTFTSRLLYIILLIIEFIQIGGLTIFHVSNNDLLTDDIESNFPAQYKHIFSFIKNIEFRYNAFLKRSKEYYIAMLYTFIFYIFVHFGIFIYFKSHFIVIKKKKNICADYFYMIIYYLDILQITVFTIPSYIIIFSFFQCDEDKTKLLNLPTLECKTPFYYTNICIASVVLLLFTFIGTINCIFLNNNQPKSKLPWSNSFNLSRTILFYQKLVLSLFFIINFDNKYYVKVVLVFGLNLAVCIIRFMNSSFLFQSVKFFSICFEFASLFFCFVGLMNVSYLSLIHI